MRHWNTILSIAATAVCSMSSAFADPLGVWRFEDRIATRAADETGGGNVAREVRASPTGPRLRPWRSAMGSGVRFPGGNAHLRVTEAQSFAMTASDSFTIEAWISRVRSAGRAQSIVARGVPGAPGSYALSLDAAGVAVGDVTDSAGVRRTVTGGAVLTDGARHHVVFVRDTATDGFRLYVDGDGAPAATATDPTTGSFSSGTLLLGAAAAEGGGTTSHFAGVLDEVRVERGVGDLFRGDATRDVLGVWHFDEGAGSTAADSSSHGNHGTLGTTGAGGAAPTWTEGVLGKSLRFDGAGSVVDVAEAVSLGIAADESFAVSAWVRSANSTGVRGIVSRRARGGTGAYSMHTSSAGTATAEVTDTAGAGATLTTRRPLRGLAARSFHHVVLVRDHEADAVRLYLDGVLRRTLPDTTTSAIGSGSLRIGGLTGATAAEDAPFAGWIDEVSVVKWGGAPPVPTPPDVLFVFESDNITQDWFTAHGETVRRIDTYPTSADLAGVRLLYVATYDPATAADRQVVRDFLTAGGRVVFDSGTPLYFSGSMTLDPIFGTATYTNTSGAATFVTPGPVMTSVQPGAPLGSDPGAAAGIIVSAGSTSQVLASWGGGAAQTTLGPYGAGECAFVSQGPGYSLGSATYDTWWGDLMEYMLRDATIRGSATVPESASGYINPGDETGGVLIDTAAGWDGDFTTATVADSNGDAFKAMTWTTTEVYRVPAGAQNVRLHGKVESANWQSSAEVLVWDFDTSAWSHAVGTDGTQWVGDGVYDDTVGLRASQVQGGEVRVRARLFAKHTDAAFAKYYGSEILYGGEPLWPLLTVRTVAIAQPDVTVADRYPFVVRDGAALVMYYGGHSPPGYAAVLRATSADGEAWTPAGPAIVHGGGWEGIHVFNACVLVEGATYKAWYTGYGGSTNQIGYATSPDGVTWTKHPANPVVRNGDWDSRVVTVGTVTRDPGTGAYRMWYTGGSDWYGALKVGHATSPDGVTWTKSPGPVFTSGTSVEWGGNQVAVDRLAGHWRMFFQSSAGDVRLVTSVDGTTWGAAREPPVLSPGAVGWDETIGGGFSVLQEGTLFRIWFAAGSGDVRTFGVAR